MKQKGFFIAIDGTDGSGKGTQSKLLCESLAELGIPYRYIDFPTYDPKWSMLVNMYLGGEFGDDPADVNCYAASSFFSLDRYCSYMLDWRADYEAGKVIVANRYTTANAVHQLAKLPEAEYDGFLQWLFDFEQTKLGLPMPDLVFYLALPPSVSERMLDTRCAETGARKDIHEKNHLHLVSADKAAHYACQRLGWVKIDCAADETKMKSREEIHEAILSKVTETLRELRRN